MHVKFVVHFFVNAYLNIHVNMSSFVLWFILVKMITPKRQVMTYKNALKNWLKMTINVWE